MKQREPRPRSQETSAAERTQGRSAYAGFWEAMKEEMTGWFEVRVDEPDRLRYW